MTPLPGSSRPPARLLAALALALLAACSGGGGGGGGSPTEPPTLSLTLTATPSSIGLNGTAQVAVQARSSGGGSVAGLAVALATSLGRLDQVTLTTDSAGRAATVLRGEGAAGVARVTAQLQGQTTAATTEVRIGLDRSLRLTVTPSTIAGAQVATVSVVAFEPDGSPVPTGTGVSLSTTAGTLAATRLATSGQGAASTQLRTGGQSGSALVTATVDGGGSATAQVTLRLPYQLTLLVNPPSIATTGRATVTVRVTALDPAAAVGGVTVRLTSTLGRLGASSLRSNAQGVASTTLDGGGSSGTAILTASLDGLADPATAALSIGGGATLRLTASPTAVAANGGQVQLTVLAAGSDGTPLSGAEVRLATNRGRLGATRLVTDGSGLAATTLTGDGRSGPATVEATLTGTSARAEVVVTFQ